MTADDDRTLDPDRVATRGFSTSFRGFDVDEVRRFLDELASALRSQKFQVSALTTHAPELEKVTTERDSLAGRILDLESRLRSLSQEAEEATAVKAELANLEAQEFDESRATELLGKETVRVLDTAREAAKEMVAKAEAAAAVRTTELDERETELTKQIEKQLGEAKKTAGEVTAAADKEAKKLVDDAATEALALTKKAKEDSAALRSAAEQSADDVRSKADAESAKLVADAEAKATSMTSAADAAAAAVRRNADADAASSQDAAREQARQMLNEAQAVREKVLADLVKRRRVGRQQLDQVKAARDRLARSLAVVRKDLDDAMNEVVSAVPDARAAMEAVGRRIPESSDHRQAAELAAELDTARVGTGLPGLPDDEEPEALPDIDELFDRIKSGDSDSDVSSTGGNAGTSAGGSGGSSSGGVSSGVVAVKSATVSPSTTGSTSGRTGGSSAVRSKKAEPAKAGVATGEDVLAQTKESRASDRSQSQVGGQPARTTAVAVVTETEDLESEEAQIETPVGATAPATATATATADTDAQVEAGPDVPSVFLERDIALTRYGPDLRRRVKRALADDQSQVLDGLRQAKTAPAVEDLPDVAAQLEVYRSLLAAGLAEAASAGATAGGGTLSGGLIDDLVDQVAQALAEPLRTKVERVVDGAADKDEAIEPIRAHYREVRSQLVVELVDDGLADAYALGRFNAISDGVAVQWVADPRVEAGPDCYDNTLAGSVTKPDPFPTGHSCPPGSPGCRCLVIPAD